MTALKNPRHELFAQNLAKGKSQHAAYLAAGFETTNDEATDACASRLAGLVEVEARVAELLERSALKVDLTRNEILQMLLQDRDLARENKQSAAAIRASELLGKEIAGMFVDKKEIKASILDNVDAGKLGELREALVAERDRRAAEGSGKDSSGTQD